MITITTLDVTGMTCGHCVSAVTNELEAVDGVNRVSVELDNGGTSHVTVISTDPLAEDLLREAIDEAGYDVTGITSHNDAEEFEQLAEVRAQTYGTSAGEGTASADASENADASESTVGPVGITLTTRSDAEASSDGSDAPEAGGCGCGCSGH